MRNIIVMLFCAAVAACVPGSEATSASALTAPGVVCDGTADARPAIQAALDAAAPGDVVSLPDGVCLVSQAPGKFGALWPHAGVTIRGQSRAGTVIKLAGASKLAIQTIYVMQAANVTITNLTVDGNAAGQTVLGTNTTTGAPMPDPHRAGVFAKQSPHLTLDNVTLRNATGDGAEIYDGSDDPSVVNVEASDNGRNGLTLGGGTVGGVFSRSLFLRNGAQQFDSEGNTVSDVTIRDCVFDALGVSQDFVLTMTGMGSDKMSHGWTVTDNVVNGGALAVWITDVVYARNTGTNPTGRPSVWVYRTADRIRIQDNVLLVSGAATFDEGAIVYVTGTGDGQTPAGVVIAGNTLTTSAPGNGVTAVGVHDIVIEGNTITGAGIAKSWQAGIFIRAAKLEVPLERAIVRRNTIGDFGAIGVRLGGGGTGATTTHINVVDISENAFSSNGAMVKALYLGDDPATVRKATQSENTMSGATTVLVTHPPGGVASVWGDGTRWVQP